MRWVFCLGGARRSGQPAWVFFLGSQAVIGIVCVLAGLSAWGGAECELQDLGAFMTQGPLGMAFTYRPRMPLCTSFWEMFE